MPRLNRSVSAHNVRLVSRWKLLVLCTVVGRTHASHGLRLEQETRTIEGRHFLSCSFLLSGCLSRAAHKFSLARTAFCEYTENSLFLRAESRLRSRADDSIDVSVYIWGTLGMGKTCFLTPAWCAHEYLELGVGVIPRFIRVLLVDDVLDNRVGVSLPFFG